MISYERTKSSNGSVKCMICNYSYSTEHFKYQQYVCNECHDFSIAAISFSDFFILNIKGVDYRVYISGIDKKEAVNILKNSKFSDKGVL